MWEAAAYRPTTCRVIPKVNVRLITKCGRPYLPPISTSCILWRHIFYWWFLVCRTHVREWISQTRSAIVYFVSRWIDNERWLASSSSHWTIVTSSGNVGQMVSVKSICTNRTGHASVYCPMPPFNLFHVDRDKLIGGQRQFLKLIISQANGIAGGNGKA